VGLPLTWPLCMARVPAGKRCYALEQGCVKYPSCFGIIFFLEYPRNSFPFMNLPPTTGAALCACDLDTLT
jgi:hypothetical protein